MSLPEELRDPDDSPRPPRRSLRTGAVIFVVVALVMALVLPALLGSGIFR